MNKKTNIVVGRAGRCCLRLLRCGRILRPPGFRDEAAGRIGRPGKLALTYA
jgi:hypothetical protein